MPNNQVQHLLFKFQMQLTLMNVSISVSVGYTYLSENQTRHLIINANLMNRNKPLEHGQHLDIVFNVCVCVCNLTRKLLSFKDVQRIVVVAYANGHMPGI